MGKSSSTGRKATDGKDIWWVNHISHLRSVVCCDICNPPTLRVPAQQEDATHLGLARSNAQRGYLMPQTGRLLHFAQYDVMCEASYRTPVRSEPLHA